MPSDFDSDYAYALGAEHTLLGDDEHQFQWIDEFVLLNSLNTKKSVASIHEAVLLLFWPPVPATATWSSPELLFSHGIDASGVRDMWYDSRTNKFYELPEKKTNYLEAVISDLAQPVERADPETNSKNDMVTKINWGWHPGGVPFTAMLQA